MSKQSVRAFPIGTIEQFSIGVLTKRKEPTIHEILVALTHYGLQAYEIKLVYYRAVQEMSFTKIVKKLNWLNRRSAEYHYKEAIKKLRKAGFSVE